jgi:hypothetical protein
VLPLVHWEVGAASGAPAPCCRRNVEAGGTCPYEGYIIGSGQPRPLAKAEDSPSRQEDCEGRCVLHGQNVFRGAFQPSCHNHRGQERATIVEGAAVHHKEKEG